MLAKYWSLLGILCGSREKLGVKQLNLRIHDVLDTLILLRWITFIVLSPQPDHDLSKSLILCNQEIFSPAALFWFWV